MYCRSRTEKYILQHQWYICTDAQIMDTDSVDQRSRRTHRRLFNDMAAVFHSDHVLR